MEEKEAEFGDILKMGRTQLQDAVPMRLGQSFGAFAHVLKRDIKRLKNVMDEMKVLNIGATAQASSPAPGHATVSETCSHPLLS